MLNLSGTRRDATELPEVLVVSKNHKLLHMLAYVREYSTLTTHTDTVLDAPALSSDILSLIDRVEKIDKNEVKLDYVTDQNMKSDKIGGRNFKIGRRALLMLKQATGITRYRARKNLNKQWNEFRKGRREAQNQ